MDRSAVVVAAVADRGLSVLPFGQGIRVSTANSGECATIAVQGAKKFKFFEMSGQKNFRKKCKSTADRNMNLVADDPISETHEFTNQFALFPIGSGRENLGERPTSRLSHEQINAFLRAEFENSRNAQFFVPPDEPPAAAPDKSLAAGVLKQTARDLRRFHSATRGLKRELYLDAYSWLMVTDFSWPYSFVNVCRLLDVCPEVIRTELLADASLGWFNYWTRRAGRLFRRLQSVFVHVFVSCRNPAGGVGRQLASCS
jgi:hypothetical protein